MGSGDVVSSFLWRARSGIRTDRQALFAGHGMADPGYRPPRLPYVSVIGPLNVELEPERDPPRAVQLWVQTPGHLAGAPRAATDIAPAPGPLTLRIDGDAEAVIALDLGASAGRPLTDDGVGPAVAEVVQAAVRAAAFTAGGAAVTDPARLAELRAVTARWDARRARLVIASGRRGVRRETEPDLRPSRVEVPPPAGPVATALGLDGARQAAPGVALEGAVIVPGRLVRHRRPAPVAVVVDVRVDLWAGSQLELAAALDTWVRFTATRGQLLERPALLAADVAPGATTVRLQAAGEPAGRWTLLQLEPRPGGGLEDRATGTAAALTGAGATAVAEGVRLVDAAAATARCFEEPPIPLAWLPEHPGSGGYAVTIGLRTDPGAAGDHARLFTLEHDGQPALTVDADVLSPNGGAAVQWRLRAEARHPDGSVFAAAVATVDVARLTAGAELHAVADAAAGTVALFLDGAPVGAVDGAATPGPPRGGAGLTVRLGDAAGIAPAVVVRHVHLAGRPLGPPDPRARAGIAPATAWAPGEPLTLARTEDGVTAGGDAFSGTVVAVDGDELTLDRPVATGYPRAATLVHHRALFFSQRQLRRTDDLMNRLFRMSAEYRVSTFLDERFPGVSAPLVETTEVELRNLARTNSTPSEALHG